MWTVVLERDAKWTGGVNLAASVLQTALTSPGKGPSVAQMEKHTGMNVPFWSPNAKGTQIWRSSIKANAKVGNTLVWCLVLREILALVSRPTVGVCRVQFKKNCGNYKPKNKASTRICFKLLVNISQMFKPLCGSINASIKPLRFRVWICDVLWTSWIMIEYCITESSLLISTETCRDVLCPGSSTCVVDQTNNAYCVTCNRICPEVMSPDQYLCGNDGIVYASACHLRRATCLLGRSIGVAYEGKCISEFFHLHLATV